MEACVRKPEDTKKHNQVKQRPGLMKRSANPDNLFDEEPNTDEDEKLSASWENLLEAAILEGKTGRLTGIFRKSPQPASRFIATEDPLSSTNDLSTSWDSLPDAAEGTLSACSESLASEKNLSDATSKQSENMEAPERGVLGHRRTIKEKRQVVSFRVKKTLPKIPEVTLSSLNSEKMPVMEGNVELRELRPAQENTVELQAVAMAAYPSEHNPPDAQPQSEQESDELMEWWNTVKGWTEWYETPNFQEDDEETMVEQAADRVYLAARLFVHLFNQRGASLQQRILELLSLADAADHFHKKTVRAAVGGGVASVAGSVATITGLILAPFTFGASVIVTAVGISVATAGGITSATANITDTVHSRMDRKKVEKMIQGYQEEIEDIRECLEFVQEGMDTLQEWDFERYSQKAAKKAFNHNMRTVLKAGGSAGRALVINTEKIISTVQILRAAGGAVKAAQVVSITTGVMSALFLALDVFFLAKDSHELRKGAKTEFAAKIREVCKELQQGLLELNKVKTQLQKTMDGIEVEEYEEIQEVEVEIEDDFESDPKKLAELEQELDLLEEKLDKRVEEELKKSKKETDKENLKSKSENMNMKEKGKPEIREDDKTEESKKEAKGKSESNSEKLPDVEKGMKTQKSVEVVVEALEKEEKSRTQKSDSQSQHRRDQRKQGNSTEQGRRQFERKASDEEETGNRREDGENQKRDKEREHSRRGLRPRSNALLGGELGSDL